MNKFDEAIVEHVDGTKKRFSYDDFYRLPLLERVKALCELRVKFFKEGRPVAAADAIK